MPIHPNARQCAYTKVDGARCGGPANDGSDFCHHHGGLSTRLRERNFTIPALDDQNSVQVALMDVINALLTRSIDRADAYAVIYALQVARNNLKGLTLSPPAPDQLQAMLEKARQEGYEAGKTEWERTRSKKDEEDSESLAAFLLRELREPQRDAQGVVLRDADGNPMCYTPAETRDRAASTGRDFPSRAPERNE